MADTDSVGRGAAGAGSGMGTGATSAGSGVASGELFNAVVPVACRREGSGEEAVVMELNTRITRTLEFTHEEDLYLLYTLTMAESSYPELKTKHEIGVDFSQFPTMLVKYFTQCREAGSNVSARLHASRAGVLFSFVQNDEFKGTPKLVLRFVQGTDEAIKGHLAGRVVKERASNAELREALALHQAELAELHERTHRLSEGAATADAETAARISALEAEHTAQTAAVERRHEAAFAEAIAEHRRQVDELRSRHEAEREALRTKLEDAKEQLGRASGDGRDSERRNEQLVLESNRLRKELEAAQRQLAETKADLTKAASSVEELRSGLGAARGEAASLELQLAEERGKVAAHRASADNATAALKALQEQYDMCRRDKDGLRSQVEEGIQTENYLKGVVGKLNAKVKEKRGLLEQRDRVVVKQEEQLHKLEQALAELREAHERIVAERHELKRTLERCKRARKEQRQQKEEALAKLETMQQTTAYLQRHMTELQVQNKTAPGTSFRPAGGHTLAASKRMQGLSTLGGSPGSMSHPTIIGLSGSPGPAGHTHSYSAGATPPSSSSFGGAGVGVGVGTGLAHASRAATTAAATSARQWSTSPPAPPSATSAVAVRGGQGAGYGLDTEVDAALDGLRTAPGVMAGVELMSKWLKEGGVDPDAFLTQGAAGESGSIGMASGGAGVGVGVGTMGSGAAGATTTTTTTTAHMSSAVRVTRASGRYGSNPAGSPGGSGGRQRHAPARGQLGGTRGEHEAPFGGAVAMGALDPGSAYFDAEESPSTSAAPVFGDGAVEADVPLYA